MTDTTSRNDDGVGMADHRRRHYLLGAAMAYRRQLIAAGIEPDLEAHWIEMDPMPEGPDNAE